MTPAGAPSLRTLKRRQTRRVTAFLVVVGAATVALFHWLRGDLVAFRRGQQALVRADFGAAVGQLDRALAGGYNHPRLRLDLARAHLGVGNHQAALALYEAALAATPQDRGLIDLAAGLYQATGAPERGIALFSRLGAPEQLSVRELSRLGDLQQQAGQYEAAIATYQLAAGRSPREPELQLRLGIVLGWTGRNEEAAAALRTALELEPGRRLAHIYLARVLVRDNRLVEAVDEYRRVLPR